MVRTIEMLEKEYEGKELDGRWFALQGSLGTEEEAKNAYDEKGEFHCIGWYDCSCCPAARRECFE